MVAACRKERSPLGVVVRAELPGEGASLSSDTRDQIVVSAGIVPRRIELVAQLSHALEAGANVVRVGLPWPHAALSTSRIELSLD
jgi:hypothetical protein